MPPRKLSPRKAAASPCAPAIEQTLQAAAEKIRKQYSAEVLAEAFDVTDAYSCAAFCRRCRQEIRRRRYLRNQRRRPARERISSPPALEEWQRAIELNFLSTVYFAREVIPHMQRKRWGRIITLTSITTKQPVTDLVLSNAVRAAVVGLVKSLANEFGKDGILVNNVGPGFTATDRLKELATARSASSGKTEQEFFDGWAADAPLKRLGRAARSCRDYRLAGVRRASYITGQTILVDGGMYKGL